MIQFQNYAALTDALSDKLEAKVRGETATRVGFGVSNQSCSRYVIVTIEDEDGEFVDEFKVRFSDHADRYGSDLTVRIDRLISEIKDEDGEYVAIEIANSDFDDAVNEAFAAVVDFISQDR